MEKSLGQKLKWQLISLLARRLPPCRTMTQIFSEERERPLTMREKIIKKLHLFTCEACRRYVAQIAQMSEMLKPREDENAVESTVKLSDEARNRIKAALEAASQPKN